MDLNKRSTLLNTLIVLIALMTAFQSCVPTGSSSSKRDSSGANVETDDNGNQGDSPTYTNSANFFQNGSTSSTTTISLASDFSTSLYLRGEQVHDFITSSNQSTVQCLFVPYTQASIKKVLILAATPKFIINFSSGSQVKEYYYLLSPSTSTQNTAFCQSAGVVSAVDDDFPSSTPVYKLTDVCPNCSLNSVLSSGVQLRSSSGIFVTNVGLTSLKIKIDNQNSENDNDTITSCSTSTVCVSKGYDCCSNGQCVNDQEVKANVDQSSEAFLQALADIDENPNAIYNYGEFFHLCGSNVVVEPTPSPNPDPDDAARDRLLYLKSLYDCTTPYEGEMALCQKKYTDVQKTITSSGSNIFETNPDDRNFNTYYSGTSTLPTHSIYEVSYAGEILFESDSIVKGMTIGPSGNGTGNDNLDDTQIINLTHTPSSTAANDDLTITYKIDGSCTQISTFLAKCYKVYLQGGNEGKVTDHFPASNSFILPYYADTNKTFSVDVDGANKLIGSDWQLVQTNPAQIQFVGDELAVFDTQVVTITFFVNLQNYPNIFSSKKNAIEEIQQVCDCGTTDCRLKEVYEDDDEDKGVVDYACYYPDTSTTTPPLQQTVILSAKTVAHRFFDKDGNYHTAEEVADDPDLEQEGNLFQYIKKNLLKPNNIDEYVGFNEIYGSLSSASGSAVPSLEVRVEKGKTYDLFADQGSFSTCYYCGTDYYSSVSRIFPQNFTSNGGGYTPSFGENDPLSTSTFRKDDLLFGRACFVPATMIPWTHKAGSTRQNQRLDRLAAQHFMFANGYQRDWYGFDYGSLIGSFDGVLWFSVGNQRRIQAKTNKLFLAINGYFGDLTDDTTWRVTVQDISTVTNSGSFITNNFESDGAECQKAHVCQVDSDCVSRLGWEYSCETITSMTTPWPRFDSNGLEVPGVSDELNMRSLFGATTGSSKRCVYRGRGAACMPNFTVTDGDNTFTGTGQFGMHSCSANNYCQPFIEGTSVASFNNKIARFGKSVKSQNASSDIEEDDLDVVGLGSRVLGRPFAWRGSDIIPISAQSNLSSNGINAMCIPGRDSNDDTLLNNQSNQPTSDSLGDKINAIGVTPDLVAGNSGAREDYLSRCSIMDTDGNYITKSGLFTSLQLSHPNIKNLAARQAISTNSLAIFESPIMTDNDIIKDFENEFIEELSYQENRCLRAPGSSCFSTLDCAPNPHISDIISIINPDDTTVTSLLNEYEIRFWQEELICSQEYSPDEEDYDASNNRCCRETGKEVSIGTSVVNPTDDSDRDLDFQNIPGMSTPLDSSTRNSRLATVWDLINPEDSSPNFPVLKVSNDDQCSSTCGDQSDLQYQFNTFATMAERTCCSKNWIRNFDEDDNGGGHAWGPTKTQTIPKESFRCYNYTQCNDSQGNCSDVSYGDFYGFNCAHTDGPLNSKCLARSVASGQADIIFNWMATLELTGIPQIAIPDATSVDENVYCEVNPNDQRIDGGNTLPPNLITNILSEPREYRDASGGEYLSSTDPKNFEMDPSSDQESNIRKIFSEDSISCCLPAGTKVDDSIDASRCCTGYIGENKTCQLPDYTNVSLYLNRYVSSEAQNEGLNDFNPDTGYLKNKVDVIRIACTRKMCESGKLVEGVSLSDLRTRGHEDNQNQQPKQRFLDGDDTANSFGNLNEIYDRGARWNSHLYCGDSLAENDLPNTFDCSDY
ncbi:MAG: hypothetical protein CME60_06080 [Halobacteriovoraceae bacterium]|nr:hypothetical protein [Halobacteriovoraceae bacterium]